MKMQLIMVFGLMASASFANAGTIIVSDGGFEESDWTIRTDGSIGGGPFSESTQVPIGGNPGTWRQVVNRGETIPFRFEQTYGWHLFDGQQYDPSEGAVLSLTYSEDTTLVGGFFNALTGYFAIEQDGFLYRSNQSYSINTTSWTTTTFPGLQPTDFQAYFGGSFLPTAHPDFSTSGSPLTFGFMRYTHGNQGSYRSETGIDNWKVELTTAEIPEPSSLFLALSATGVVLCIRVRRKFL